MRTKPSSARFTPRESDLEENHATEVHKNRIILVTELPIVVPREASCQFIKNYDKMSEASKLAGFAKKIQNSSGYESVKEWINGPLKNYVQIKR